MRDSFRVLQDVSHLLKQDTVLSFNLSVSLYSATKLMAIRVALQLLKRETAVMAAWRDHGDLPSSICVRFILVRKCICSLGGLFDFTVDLTSFKRCR